MKTVLPDDATFYKPVTVEAITLIEGVISGDPGAKSCWDKMKKVILAGKSLTLELLDDYLTTVERLSVAPDGDLVVDLRRVEV